MSDRFFLDTNVFGYEFQSDQRKRERASELIRRGDFHETGSREFSGGTGVSRCRTHWFRQAASVSDAETYLSAVFKPLLSVHSSPRLFLEALRIHGQHQFSWYDSLIVAAAQQAECSVLYTEDLQNGRRLGSLRIEDPFR